jgi:ABC-type bacteriocin/lantibiotic exporter with double-glycine peptidase domain
MSPKGTSQGTLVKQTGADHAWLAALGQGADALTFTRRVLHFGQPLEGEDARRIGVAILEEGRARLLISENGEERHVVALHPGDTITVSALKQGGLEPLTVRASSARTVFSTLDEEALKGVLRDERAGCILDDTCRRLRVLCCLRRLPRFAELSDATLNAVAGAIEHVTLEPGADPQPYRGPGGLSIFFLGDVCFVTPEGDEISLEPGDVLSPSFITDKLEARIVRRSELLWIAPSHAERLSADDRELAGAFADADASPGAPDAAAHGAGEESTTEDIELLGHVEPAQRARRIRRIPLVRQIDETDCGAACLAMVCRHFGRRISTHVLRRLLYTTADGVSLRAICHAANQLGLAARAAKISKRNLGSLPLPAIVRVDGNHWVVLYDVTRRWARIADPATGHQRIRSEEFLHRWDGYVALFDYTDDFKDAPEEKKNVAWLWQFVRPWSRIIAQATLLAGVVALLELTFPIFTQIVFDTVLVDRDIGLLWSLVAAMLVVLVFLILSMFLQRYLLSFVAVRIDGSTLDFLTRRLLSLPVSYFASRRTGDLRRRLEGTRLVRDFVVSSSVRVLIAFTQLGSALLLLGVYSFELFGLFVLTAPVYILLMRLSARWLGPLFAQLEWGFADYDSHQIDAIRGIETVKAMGAEPALRQKMLDAFHDLASRQFRADLSRMSYEAGVHALGILLTGAFLIVGAWQALHGRITIGGLVAVNTLVAMANIAIATLMRAWDDSQLAGVLLDRIQDVLVEEPEQGRDRAKLIPVRRVKGEVELVSMGFSYPGIDSRPVIEDLNIHVRPGMKVALVGRSGCGKTTLVKCLAGLYMPTQGRLLIDGLDISRLNLADLRRHIGFVLQETHLFDGSIAANIALNEEAPDMARVIRAAQTACAAEFIEELPMKYDTRVGERGVGLSSGQRQRISIARALYHDPKILVLDEATSALDVEAERSLQQNLNAWVADRTCFIVAHRLATVRDASLTVVLEAGRIVEAGTHEALLARQGLYYHFCGQKLDL